MHPFQNIFRKSRLFCHGATSYCEKICSTPQNAGTIGPEPVSWKFPSVGVYEVNDSKYIDGSRSRWLLDGLESGRCHTSCESLLRPVGRVGTQFSTLSTQSDFFFDEHSWWTRLHSQCNCEFLNPTSWPLYCILMISLNWWGHAILRQVRCNHIARG